MEGVLHAEMEGIDMSEWIKYDGSDKQIEEIKTASKGILCKLNSDEGKIKQIMLKSWHSLDEYSDLITEYLICQPHPYADLIKIWADTGCQVWVRPTKPYAFEVSDYENHPTTKLMVDHKGVYLITTAPDWNIPGEYRLTPFND